MKRMLQIILLALLIIITVSGYALWANDLPWSKPPGFMPRLSIYLSQNVAETSAQPILPELQTRTLAVEATQLLNQVTKQVIAMGWQLQAVDADKLEIMATVQTRWLKFSDDIHIRLEPLANKHTRLHIRSASRIGRADFGANLSHILRLYRYLDI